MSALVLSVLMTLVDCVMLLTLETFLVHGLFGLVLLKVLWLMPFVWFEVLFRMMGFDWAEVLRASVGFVWVDPKCAKPGPGVLTLVMELRLIFTEIIVLRLWWTSGGGSGLFCMLLWLSVALALRFLEDWSLLSNGMRLLPLDPRVR